MKWEEPRISSLDAVGPCHDPWCLPWVIHEPECESVFAPSSS